MRRPALKDALVVNWSLSAHLVSRFGLDGSLMCDEDGLCSSNNLRNSSSYHDRKWFKTNVVSASIGVSAW